MDKAPAHAHPMQQRIYDQYEVSQLLWCGNSPDLNMIEPAWAHLKRETTKKVLQRTVRKLLPLGKPHGRSCRRRKSGLGLNEFQGIFKR
ncbi:hypothetical protein E4U14_000235 [Claviceps sp. LM454 group G7]|nr:hypothetical protein E4U14_000235 [Claviceps sp. LM454 group G7]